MEVKISRNFYFNRGTISVFIEIAKFKSLQHCNLKVFSLIQPNETDIINLLLNNKGDIMSLNEEKFELLCQGDSRLLKINAIRGELFRVEAGSMVAMTPTFEHKVKAGSIGKMFGRVMSGESALLQEYRATSDGEILLAPTGSGDITKVELDGSKQYRISNGNFLACTEGITLEAKAKVKGIFGSGEGIFGLRTVGAGTLFVNSCGSIHKINLNIGEEYIVDSSHLVLWENEMEFSTELAGGGLASSFLSGEGFVARFRGPGQIWIQTRKPIVVASNG